MDNKLPFDQIRKIRRVLVEATRNANEANNIGNQTDVLFYKGQVLGIANILQIIDTDKNINITFYLNQLPK